MKWGVREDGIEEARGRVVKKNVATLTRNLAICLQAVLDIDTTYLLVKELLEHLCPRHILLMKMMWTTNLNEDMIVAVVIAI